MPNLFESLNPSTYDATSQAASVLSARLASIRPPRSIAELRLSDGDHDWLQRWASSLSLAAACQPRLPYVLDGCAFTRQQAFGLIFIAFAAETARRDASEGAVWPHIRKPISVAAEAELFVSGQPATPLKHAMETASRFWRLRHAFDEEQQAAWYRSIYLQFGFTRRSIETNLTVWLAHTASMPAAVSSLLHDHRLQCTSFETLWRTLRDLRRRNLSNDKARQILSDNPWVLRDWNEDLRAAATARQELGTAPDEDIEAEPSLFTAPCLEWNGGTPGFRVELVNLTDTVGDLEPGAYRIRIGETVAEFRVDEYGTLHGTQYVLLAAWPAKPVAVLERWADEDWSPVATEEIVIWEPEDEVAVFAEGLRQDAWKTPMHQDRSYDLVLAPGLVVHPPELMWHDPSGCRILHLEAGWPETLAIHLEGDDDPLWDPILDAKQSTRRLALNGVTSTAVVPIGIEPTLSISGVPEQVIAVWAGGQKVLFRQDETVLELKAPTPVATSVQVRTRGVDGTLRIGRVDISRSGAQHLGPDGWVAFPVDTLDVRDCGRRIRVFADGIEEPVLRLGDRIIGPCGKHGRSVFLATSWGAELACGDGRFNRDPEREMSLAKEVTDHGVVHRLELYEDLDGAVSVILRHPIQPDSTTVYAVNLRGHAERVYPQAAGELGWVLDEVPDCALLVVNNCELIGSWWLQPPEQPETLQDALSTSMLLRDGHAPLLNWEFRRWTRTLLRSYPYAALAWSFRLTEGRSVPIDPPDADRFAPVVRHLLQDWHPDTLCIDRLLASFQDADSSTYDKLAESVIRTPLPVCRLIRATRDAMAQAETKARIGWQPQSNREALEFMGSQLGVHPGFLEGLGDQICNSEQGGNLLPIQEENLLTAMNLSVEYRRWLAGRFLTGA